MFFKKRAIREKIKVLETINHRHVEYVSERNRESYEETVLGHGGAISIKDDLLRVYAGDGEVFRCFLTEDIEVGELMNLSGAVITGFDINEQRKRTIVAYYKYYRKI